MRANSLSEHFVDQDVALTVATCRLRCLATALAAKALIGRVVRDQCVR